MILKELIGKRIISAKKMKKPEYDDTGWLLLEFDDGTKCVIEGGYEEVNTTESEGEYPSLLLVHKNSDGLVDA